MNIGSWPHRKFKFPCIQGGFRARAFLRHCPLNRGHVYIPCLYGSRAVCITLTYDRYWFHSRVQKHDVCHQSLTRSRLPKEVSTRCHNLTTHSVHLLRKQHFLYINQSSWVRSRNIPCGICSKMT